MGKLKRNKFRKHLKAQKDSCDNEAKEPFVEHSGLESIKDKLTSKVIEEQISALVTLASLTQDGIFSELKHIMLSGVVPIITDLVKSPDPNVRAAAVGVLRNLSAEDSEEIAETILELDGFSKIAVMLEGYLIPWYPKLNSDRDVVDQENDPVAHGYIHAVSCVWNLCECSQKALMDFNETGLVNVLVKHINPDIWGLSVAQISMHCLLCVSENNSKVTSVLEPLTAGLLSYLSPELHSFSELLFATTVAGLLLNASTDEDDRIMKKILHLLAAVLQLDGPGMCQNSKSVDDALPQQMTGDLRDLFSAQSYALEILSNICYLNADAEEGDVSCSFDGNDSMDVDGESSIDVKLPHEVEECILHLQLVDKVKEKAFLEDHIVDSVSKEKTSHWKEIGALRVKALFCFQNMLSALVEITGTGDLYSMWAQLGQIIFNNNNSEDEALLEAAAGAMRAVMERLGQTPQEEFKKISVSDLEIIFSACHSCRLCNMRANLTRSVGILGHKIVSHFSEEELKNDSVSNVIALISGFLLKVAAQDSEIWVCAEALDNLIDIYSDDKTDTLAVKVQLLAELRTISPLFKSKGSFYRT